LANLDVSRGERLDQRVVSLIPTLSRAFAAQLITDGKVTIDGEVVSKPGTKIKPYDDVKVNYELSSFEIPHIELEIIYEDDDCVVINKPTGLLSHSKGAFNPEPSVATWLHNKITDENLLDEDKDSLNNRAGIVHRLDRATSGVMICAKTLGAQRFLQKQFADRKVQKTYLAIIVGQLSPFSAVIDLPIERNPKKPATFRVGANGKTAQTRYDTLKTDGHYSLIELQPKTGRTHQLRVHLKYLSHPIVGDNFYGGEPFSRLLLHASKLNINLPSGQAKVFKAEQPPEFEDLLSD
jgi:23S rRNA pseudouridine1911/1915/1917 synthase